MAATAAAPSDLKVEEGFADSNGVKIHYATMGAGPLVVMIHGFPDFWFTWRKQMAGLADKYQTVAIDQRGYNLSDNAAHFVQQDAADLVTRTMRAWLER